MHQPPCEEDLLRLPARGTLGLKLEVPRRSGIRLTAAPFASENRSSVRATVSWAHRAGPPLDEATAPIYRDDTPESIHERVWELGGRLLSGVVQRLLDGRDAAVLAAVDERSDPIEISTEASAGGAHARNGPARRWIVIRGIVKFATAFFALSVYRPLRDVLRSASGGHPIRIFTFHRVTHLCRDGMTVSPTVFRRQLEYVRRHHDVVTVERAVELVRRRRRLRRPVAVLTFDDAYRSVYDVARPILAELGLPACCFASTDLVGNQRQYAHDVANPVRRHLPIMEWSHLGQLLREGWAIGGHGASHLRLSECVGETLRAELVEPLDTLRRQLGVERPPLAYPFGGEGDFSPEARSVARATGYSACFSNFGGDNFPGANPFELKRIDIGGNHGTTAWKCRVHEIDLSRWRDWWDRTESPRSAPSTGTWPPTVSGRTVRRPVRVTHVVFDLEGGGMESLVAGLAMWFRRADTAVAVSVITLSGRPGRVGSTIRSSVDQFHAMRPIRGFSMIAPFRLANRIRATAPDVVHLHSGSWYKGSLAARMARVRGVIYTEHGREHDDPAVTRWLHHKAQARTDIVVPVSDRLARYMVARVGVSPGRVRTIQNGVDTISFSPGPTSGALRQRLGIPAEAWVLGSVGRLEPVKAYQRLIHVLAQLVRVNLPRPLYLVLCGDGSQRDFLEQEAARLGVGHQVRLLGWSETPVEVYRLLDIFGLTSVSEGASLSLMEAMACGVVPVVMDVGANAEILGPELEAQVVPPGDLGAFARVVRETLMADHRLEILRRSVRLRAEERYSFDRMAREYEQLYWEVSGLAAMPDLNHSAPPVHEPALIAAG